MEVDQPVTTETSTPAAADTSPASSVTDLDGLSEFTWQGEKRSPDWLHQIYSEHKTLSEQHKSFAQEQKFTENLEADLDNVLKDPNLAQRFKEVYPKKFHGLVDRLLKTGQATAQPTTAQPNLSPEVLQRLENQDQRLKFFEERAYQSEVQSASAAIDKVTGPLFEKYGMANEDQVFSRAEAALQGGQKLTGAVWERLIRESHEKMTKKVDQINGAKLKEQIEKGKRGADTGPGGSAPGAAPKRAGNISSATDDYIASLGSR